jgi:hypothetical protein
LFRVRGDFAQAHRAFCPRKNHRSSYAMMSREDALMGARREGQNKIFFLFSKNCACKDLRND